MEDVAILPVGGRVEKSIRMCYRLDIDPNDEFMSCFCAESHKYPFERSQFSLGYTTLGLRTEIKAKYSVQNRNMIGYR